MKFAKTSQFVATSVFGALVVSLTLPASSVKAAIYTFEMTVAPDSEPQPMTKIEDGFGDSGAGDFGPPLNAGLQGNGTARLVDSGGNGLDGYEINQLGGGISTFTVDMYVRANNTVLPSGGNDIR